MVAVLWRASFTCAFGAPDGVGVVVPEGACTGRATRPGFRARNGHRRWACFSAASARPTPARVRSIAIPGQDISVPPSCPHRQSVQFQATSQVCCASCGWLSLRNRCFHNDILHCTSWTMVRHVRDRRCVFGSIHLLQHHSGAPPPSLQRTAVLQSRTHTRKKSGQKCKKVSEPVAFVHTEQINVQRIRNGWRFAAIPFREPGAARRCHMRQAAQRA